MTHEFMKQIMNGEEKCCPMCGRYAKVYRRRIYKSVAIALRRLYLIGGAEGYKHIRDFMGKMTSSGDIAMAAHWGLIVSMANEDGKKKHSGLWHLTQKGVEYVNGRMGIKEFALFYDSKLLELQGDNVYFNNAVGLDFDYQEIMK